MTDIEIMRRDYEETIRFMREDYSRTIATIRGQARMTTSAVFVCTIINAAMVLVMLLGALR